MPEVSFPGDGQDGEQPPPAVPARDETGGMPDDDWDPEAEEARFIADLDAGRARIPEEWEIESRPPVTISLGDAADVDPAELAAMLGPDGLGGEVFAQDRPADVLRPGPLLSALTERAAGDPAKLSDNELLGAMSAARRLAARAEHLELRAIAEFTARQDARYQAAVAAKVPPGRRDGEFADAELAMELVTSPNAARDRMDLADHLRRRLPATNGALAAGLIDGYRAYLIWRWTRMLTTADAARADEVLADMAPQLRYDQLARRALALAMKLDPEAVKRAKEKARADGQRVEARREESGNACLNGRELAVEDVLASKAHIDAMATKLRNGGMAGSLRQLRVLAYLDLTQGRNPLDRLASPGGETVQDPHTHSDSHHCPDTDTRTGTDETADSDSDSDAGAGEAVGNDGDQDDDPGKAAADGDGRRARLDEDPYGDDGNYAADGPGGPGAPAEDPAPFPALINLTIPAASLLGWSDAPGDIGGWGLADSTDIRRLAQAAAQHPATRWCTTVTRPDGTGIAHGCARGPRPWIPPPPGPATPDSTTRAGPGPGQAAALAELLRRLNVTLHPIARGTCDHRHREDRYTPSRALKHLVRARTATCPAPGCGAQAYHNDLDHTVAYPVGATDECNLSPPCRRHHRVKQAPGWQLSQPEPGVMRWTTPSGRVYATRPTVYET
jgi:Domain of unknown function (DUF222)